MEGDLKDDGLPNAHALLNACWCDTLPEAEHELDNLLNVDDVLVLFVCTLLILHPALRVYRMSALRSDGIHRNDLRTSGDLQ